MGRTRRNWTEEVIARRIFRGLGEGTHETFRSWFEFLDFSSSGTTTRAYFPEMGRSVLTFSNIEYAAALYAVSKPSFIDYREQVRLCRCRTRAIAERLGVRHPRYRGTTIDCVMTLDGVLTLKGQDGELRHEAYDCKWSKALHRLRDQQIQAIHRAYCEEEGWTHRLITQRTFPREYSANLSWIRVSLMRDGEPEPVPGAFTFWPQKLFEAIERDRSTGRGGQPLHAYCTDFTAQHSLPPGFGLRCAKLLLWQRWLNFPMTLAKLQFQPIAAFSVSEARTEWVPPQTPSDVDARGLCRDYS